MIVTMGATLLATASVVKAASPDSVVAVFALVRTRTLVRKLARWSPCLGSVRLRTGGEKWREP